MSIKNLNYLIALTMIGPIAYADKPSLRDAFLNGKTQVQLRPRYSHADQEDLNKGRAFTLRTKVFYESDKFYDVKFGIELVDVSSFFGQKYNPDVDGLRKTEYAIIRDPKGTELRELYVKYKGAMETEVIIGRQYLNYDNERFISKVDFRQIPQSFDAVTINNNAIEYLNLSYSFATHINTTDGNERSNEGQRTLRTHIARASWSGFYYGKLIGYLYTNRDKDVDANSNMTIGFRAEADDYFKEVVGFDYGFDIAKQYSKFNNPNNYSNSYFGAHITKTVDMINFHMGYEHIGGDEINTNQAFSFPLGNYHNFNGLADVFVTTPNQGLEDWYAGASINMQDQYDIGFSYHYFCFANGSPTRAGQELDIVFNMKLSDEITLKTAYGHFTPKNNSGLKTKRFWAGFTVDFI